MSTSVRQFTVDRKNLADARYDELPSAALKDGEVRLKVDRFGFTANNITYAVAGDSLKYWDFFPATNGRGIVPVWGFADVVESSSEHMSVGERFYGYLPMASSVVIKPDAVGKRSYIDVSEHRPSHAPIYNTYQRVSDDERFTQPYEDLYMLLWPLFATGFLIDDFLADNDFFGAGTVVVVSASSRTALGLAHQLHQRDNIRLVGLTSAKNRDFAESVGCYDQVLTYPEIPALNAEEPMAAVDMAGNQAVLAQLHNHYGDNLKHTSLVGATHWDQAGQPDADLPGAKPVFFFAPSQFAKCVKKWGVGGLQRNLNAAWDEFSASVDGWMEVVSHSGAQQLNNVYQQTLAGQSKPGVGQVVTFEH